MLVVQQSFALLGVHEVTMERRLRERRLRQHSYAQCVERALHKLPSGHLAGRPARDHQCFSFQSRQHRCRCNRRAGVHGRKVLHAVIHPHFKHEGVQFAEFDRRNGSKAKNDPGQARRMQHVLTGQLMVGIVFIRVKQLVSLARRGEVLRTTIQGDGGAEDNTRPVPRRERGLQEVPRAADVDGLRPCRALFALGRNDKGQVDDRVDTLYGPCDDLRVADVAPNDFDLASIGPSLPLRQGQRDVQTTDGRSTDQQFVNGVCSDVSKCARYQDLHVFLPLMDSMSIDSTRCMSAPQSCPSGSRIPWSSNPRTVLSTRVAARFEFLTRRLPSDTPRSSNCWKNPWYLRIISTVLRATSGSALDLAQDSSKMFHLVPATW